MYEDEEWLVQLMTGAVQDERYTPLAVQRHLKKGRQGQRLNRFTSQAESELLDIQDDGSCRVRGPTQELLSVSNAAISAPLRRGDAVRSANALERFRS